MDIKLSNFSEISKLLSVKSKMSTDILNLFSKFGLGHLLCRLSLEKHDGIFILCTGKASMAFLRPARTATIVCWNVLPWIGVGL